MKSNVSLPCALMSLILGSGLLNSSTSGESVSLVFDYEGNAPLNTQPQGLISFNHEVFFRTNLTTNLYRTAGTAGTTIPIEPTPVGTRLATFLAPDGDQLLVLASRPDLGMELAHFDPRSSNVQWIRDIAPGPADAGINNFVHADDRFYFIANDATHGWEFWQTNGTELGTTMVGEIRPGADGVNPNFERTFVLGNRLVAFVDDGIHGREPWLIDGPNGQVSLIRDIVPGPVGSFTSNTSSQEPAVSIGSIVVFTTRNINNGLQVWATAGDSDSTVQLAGNDGFPGTDTTRIFHWQNRAVFDARTDAFGPKGWFTTDGTVEGTEEIQFAEPLASAASLRLWPFGDLIAVTALVQGNPELWLTDLTPEGTRKIYSGIALGWELRYVGTIETSGISIFGAALPDEGIELWATDGTLGGTFRIADLNPGPDSFFSGVRQLLPDGNLDTIAAISGSRVFLSGDDGIHGEELWVTDGTRVGTHLVRDLRPGNGIDPSDFAAAQSRLFFLGNLENTGPEIWTTDGTAEGTHITRDVRPGPRGSAFDGLNSQATLGDLIITKLWTVQGPRLFRSDGTAAGTYDLPPSDLIDFEIFNSFEGRVYFSGARATAPNQSIWSTDGTILGTQLHAVLPPSAEIRSGFVTGEGALAGTLFFNAQFGAQGAELWKLSPGNQSLELVRDINPGDASSSPYSFNSLGDQIIFVATDSDHGLELWGSDGTSKGTQLIRDIAAGPTGSNPSGFTRIGGQIVFVANDGLHGAEPWVTDGTESGTHLLADIFSGTEGSIMEGGHFAQAGGLAYFAAYTDELGIELWVTDGTSAGTRLVRDISPGADSTGIWSLTASGDNVYFVGQDSQFGAELWRSDGSTAGTYRVLDLVPGSGSSMAPGNINGPIVAALGTIFFSADDFEHGPELWKLSTEISPDIDGNGAVGMEDLVRLLSGFGSCTTDLEYTRSIDLNEDGCITIQDLAQLLSAFGT